MLNFLQESVRHPRPLLKPSKTLRLAQTTWSFWQLFSSPVTCWDHLWPVYRKPRALLHRFIHSVTRSAAPSASSRARSLSAFSPWNEIRIEQYTIFLNTVPLLISIKSLKSSIPTPLVLLLSLYRSLNVCVSLSFHSMYAVVQFMLVTPALMLCLGCCCLFSFLLLYFSTIYFTGDLLGCFVVKGEDEASTDMFW